MTDRKLSLQEVLRLLPPIPEFDALRVALLHGSSQDDAKRWTGAAKYATVDTRIIATSVLDDALAEADATARRRGKALHDAAKIAFSSLSAGSTTHKVDQLVHLAEAAEAADDWREAIALYSLANAVATMSDVTEARILAERRLGRAYLNAGNLRESIHFYSKSLADAAAAGDDLGQIVAATGLGNAAGYAGRWSEADNWYSRALKLCGSGNDQNRIELLLNRATCARERNMLSEAERWLALAHPLWDRMSEPLRCHWYNTRGLLYITRKELNEAEAAFMDAMECAIGQFTVSMILDNLAEVAMQRGDFDLALSRVRAAEENALAHGSPRALAEIYMRLGRWCSLQNDTNGVAFFEKAIDLAHDQQYPLLLGHIYREYAQFRIRMRDTAAAKAMLTQALSVYAMLGAHELVQEVEASLQSFS